jgi:two-component system chemotaxis response regulator CheB
MAKIRVLVVDDSAFARKVIREALEAEGHIEVIGIARNGLDALEKIEELRPDVITLDLNMPFLDGLGVLRALRRPDAPRVLLVSASAADSELAMEALQAGAVDLVHKPTAIASARLYDVGGDLVEKVTAAAIARAPRSFSPAAASPDSAPRATTARATRLVVIGTSTGGPQALNRLVPALPPRFPVPVAVALHIPPGYTHALAHRLGTRSAARVVEARDGLELEPGMVVIAPGGLHLRIRNHGRRMYAHLDLAPLTAPHHPSVDVLFSSAASAAGSGVLGIVLTGMGDDGLAGARAIRAVGGRILTESEESCVIYGMPRAVQEAGLADAEAPLDRMIDLLLEQL